MEIELTGAQRLKFTGKKLKMRKHYLIIILLFISPCIFAQGIPDTLTRFFQIEKLAGNKYMDIAYKYLGLYYFEEWTNGKILLSSGEEIENISLHYNGYTDQLLWLKDNVIQIIIDKKSLSGFSLFNAGKEYKFRKYRILSSGDTVNNFCQELYKGKVNLLVVRHNRLDCESIHNYIMYYVYVPSPAYFIYKNGKSINLKKMRLSALYKAFPERKEILKQKAKEKHVRVKSEEDFVKAVQALEEFF